MRTACWNCRGLGNDSTVRRLKEINRKYLLDIICLSETKQQDDVIRDVGAQLDCLNYVSVPPIGLSGGLVLYWKAHVQLQILFQSANLIDCKVHCNGSWFYYSFVYGHPNQSMRHYTWEKLERLAITRRNEAWMVLGDFNEILGNHEKDGGAVRCPTSFISFNNMIRNSGLLEFLARGNTISWQGRRVKGKGAVTVRCRLDRPVVAFLDDKINRRKRGQFRFDKRWIGQEGLM